MHKSTIAHVSREELMALYNDQRLTIWEIGKRFGVSDEVVRYRMKQLNIPRRSKSEAAKKLHLRARKLRLDRSELERLYVLEGLDTPEIGRRFGVTGDTVRRYLVEYGIERRDKSTVAIRYSRRDFSGDLLEKAYLIGLRQGDLWVAPTSGGPISDSITITCTTTHLEQIDLFKAVFTSYGHVAVNGCRNGNYVVRCHLSRSFEFLLPKQDCIPKWILDDSSMFVAFLAGYTDAEGCFCVPADGNALFRLQSYDVTILHQAHSVLNHRLEIICPSPRLAIPKGYPTTDGYRLRQDCWSLTVKRKMALYRLCILLEPRLKHSKRRRDMYAVWQNVVERGIEEN